MSEVTRFEDKIHLNPGTPEDSQGDGCVRRRCLCLEFNQDRYEHVSPGGCQGLERDVHRKGQEGTRSGRRPLPDHFLVSVTTYTSKLSGSPST